MNRLVFSFIVLAVIIVAASVLPNKSLFEGFADKAPTLAGPAKKPVSDATIEKLTPAPAPAPAKPPSGLSCKFLYE